MRDTRPKQFLKTYIRKFLKRNDLPPSIVVMLLDRLAALDDAYKVELNMPRRTYTAKTGMGSEEPDEHFDIDAILKRGDDAAKS